MNIRNNLYNTSYSSLKESLMATSNTPIRKSESITRPYKTPIYSSANYTSQNFYKKNENFNDSRKFSDYIRSPLNNKESKSIDNKRETYTRKENIERSTKSITPNYYDSNYFSYAKNLVNSPRTKSNFFQVTATPSNKGSSLKESFLSYDSSSRLNSPSRKTYTKFYLPEKSITNKNKKTLVLDLDETLVHSNFRGTNIKSDIVLKVDVERKNQIIHVLKRPGVEQFLDRMSKHYELVIFTASISSYANPLIDQLDTGRTITYRLYREHCTPLNGMFVKEMHKLGRDLKDVIIIDNNPISFAYNTENGLPIQSWYSDKSDQELFNYIPLLEFLAYSEDVKLIIPKIVSNNQINFRIVNSLIEKNKNQNKTPVRNSNTSNTASPVNYYKNTALLDKDDEFSYRNNYFKKETSKNTPLGNININIINHNCSNYFLNSHKKEEPKNLKIVKIDKNPNFSQIQANSDYKLNRKDEFKKYINDPIIEPRVNSRDNFVKIFGDSSNEFRKERFDSHLQENNVNNNKIYNNYLQKSNDFTIENNYLSKFRGTREYTPKQNLADRPSEIRISSPGYEKNYEKFIKPLSPVKKETNSLNKSSYSISQVKTPTNEGFYSNKTNDLSSRSVDRFRSTNFGEARYNTPNYFTNKDLADRYNSSVRQFENDSRFFSTISRSNSKQTSLDKYSFKSGSNDDMTNLNYLKQTKTPTDQRTLKFSKSIDSFNRTGKYFMS